MCVSNVTLCVHCLSCYIRGTLSFNSGQEIKYPDQGLAWFCSINCTLVQALRVCTGRAAYRGVEVQLYPFMTTALEGGEESASRPGRSLPPRKTQYPLYRRHSGPQGWSRQVRKILPLPGFIPRTVQPIASPYTELPGPRFARYLLVNDGIVHWHR